MGKSKFNVSAKWKRTFKGRVYHSVVEKNCAIILLAQEAAGEIVNLTMQPSFFFPIDGEPLKTYTGKQKMKYIGDFMYSKDAWVESGEEPSIETFVIDAKERPTKDFMIKWCLVRHLYPDITFLLWNERNGFHEC